MSEVSLFDTQAMRSDLGTATPAATHSLYRKYRPTSFADDDLVGQEHVVNTLRNAIALDRVAHAYLFCGPRGTGKTTTARLLAKAVNCLDPNPQQRPCNQCVACVAINTNATTDVIEIDAASNRGIDDIRDLRERVKYAPTQLKSKFYIIDEAHQITGAAANAFLKTLEEPPAHTRFVLATTDPEELLQTIVSRCQRFDFRRINLTAMVSRLRTVADSEGLEVEDDALPVIARQATGSLRDALGILDQVSIYRESADEERGPVTAESVREVLGISRNDRVESLVRALSDNDPAAGLRQVAEAVDAGDDIRQLGRQLVGYLRLLLLHKAGGETDADEIARQFAFGFSMDDLAALLRHFSEIDFKSKRATLPQLPLEIAIVEGATRSFQAAESSAQAIAQPITGRRTVPSVSQQQPPSDFHDHSPYQQEASKATQPPDAPRKSGGLRDRVRGNATMASQRESAPPQPSRIQGEEEPAIRMSTPIPVPLASRPAAATNMNGGNSDDLDQLMDLWPQVRADVKAVNRRIEALLQQVDPGAVKGSSVILVSPYEFHRNRINSDDVRRVVEDAIARLLGRQVQVSCVAREELPGHSSSGLRPVVPAPSQSLAVESEVVAAEGPPVHDDPANSTPPSPAMTAEEIEERLTAARNIFDAEEVF